MFRIHSLVFRNLTDADFFNINKPTGSEDRGGGQSYIDFPVRSVSVAEWERFFMGAEGVARENATQGPSWIFPVRSIGLTNDDPLQQLKIYQRRAASVSIASQKLHSRRSNRVMAWHPDNGFPRPIDNTIRHQCPIGLVVYLVRTSEDQIWAGWYLNDGMSQPPITGNVEGSGLEQLLAPDDAENGHSQMVSLEDHEVYLNIENLQQPFAIVRDAEESEEDNAGTQETEEEILALEEEAAEELFEGDLLRVEEPRVEYKQQILKIRQRNSKIVKKLKELYDHECQITGTEYVFAKKNGQNYTEAHHLVPLGEGGADSPANLVVLSPLIHAMLHYADVTEIDLGKILKMDDGSALLEISINEVPYTIYWHPKHAELFSD